MKKVSIFMLAIVLTIVSAKAQSIEDDAAIICYAGWKINSGYSAIITNKLSVGVYYEVTFPDGSYLEFPVYAGPGQKVMVARCCSTNTFVPGAITLRRLEPRTNTLTINVYSSFPKRRC